MDAKPRRKPPREKKTGDYVFAAVFQALVLVAINNYALWIPHTHGVVSWDFSKVVWASSLAASVELVGSLLLAFYRPPSMKTFTRLCIGVASFISIGVFLGVFPLDFSRIGVAWLNPLAKVGLLIGICVTAIDVVVSAVRFIFGGPKTFTPQGPAATIHR